MSSQRHVYSCQFRQGTVDPNIFSSYDMLKWGFDFLVMHLRVHQVTIDHDFGRLNCQIENSYWSRVAYCWLQPNHDDRAHSFFSGVLSDNQIPEDEEMINGMISCSRAISSARVTRKDPLFDPLPLMIVDVYLSSSTLERVLEESMEGNTFNPVAATKSSIDALEKVIVDGSFSTDQCMICLEKFRVGSEVVTRMPCFHVYHGNCIVRWLQTSHFCPVCRFQMPT